MAKQLHFEGDPAFEPSNVHKILDHYFVKGIKEMLSQDMVLDFNRVLYGYGTHIGQPHHEAQYLFEPAPKCHHDQDVGEEWISCDLDAGHPGDHYDANRRIDWRSR